MTEPNVIAMFGINANHHAETLQRAYIGAYGQPKYRDDDRPVSNPELYLGLELEIEEMRRTGGNQVLGMWATKDGSLRGDYAYEYITYPTKLKHLRNLLNTAVNDLKLSKENYSDRCSIHAHANVQDYTEDQLKSVFLGYQTLEGLLFKFVGHYRDEGLYAVPWSGTKIAERLLNNKLDRVSIKKWQKYTALNVIPVASQGTIEFRHLEGTCDVERIMQWLNIIGSILRFGKETKFEDHKAIIMDMNTVSSYDKYLQDVFKGGFEAPLLKIEDYKYELECGVMHTKHMLIQREEEKKGDFFGANYDPDHEGLDDEDINMLVAPREVERQPRLNAAAQRDALQRYRELIAQGNEAREAGVAIQAAQVANNPINAFIRWEDGAIRQVPVPVPEPQQAVPPVAGLPALPMHFEGRARQQILPRGFYAPANRDLGPLRRYQEVYGNEPGSRYFLEDSQRLGRNVRDIFTYFP